MSKKKWMSSLLAAALAFTTVFSTSSAVKAGDTQETTDKIVVYVAAEGTDADGHTVNIGKTAVQVDEGTKGDVVAEKAFKAAGLEESEYVIEDKSGYGRNIEKIGDIANPSDWQKGYWAFYLNGDYADSLGNVVMNDNDKISFIFAYGDDANKKVASVYSDDVSKNPDSAKTATLLENAKIQQDIVAEATYESSILDGGKTVYGIENPDALYIAFSLIRAGYTAANDYYEKMYAKVKEQLEEIKANGSITVDGKEMNLDTIGAITSSKANPEINRAKVVLFVTAMGKDATNIGGCDLIDEMAQKAVYEKSPKVYMLDCTMLLALDSGNYTLPTGENYITRGKLVNNVATSMDSMIETALQWSSIDMAAMPIQCMYPYTLENNLAAKDADFDQKALQTAYNKGVHFLESTQNNDGTWSGYGEEKNNVWTLAQILTAMGQLRINPCSETDGSDFIKNGVTVLDDAAEFFDMENKTLDTAKVPSAPEQLLRGLNAVIRVMEESKSLYDLSDVTKNPDPTQTPIQTPTGTPTGTPAQNPTATPTGTPAQDPTATPTGTPAQDPTTPPTGTPVQNPTTTPTETPADLTPTPTGAGTQTAAPTPTGNVVPTPSVTPSQTPAATPSATPKNTTKPASTLAAVKKVTAVKTTVAVKAGKKAKIRWNVTTAKNASVKKFVKVMVNKKTVKVVKTSVKKKKAIVTQVTTTIKGIKKGSAVVTLKADGKKSKVKVIVK